MPNKKMSVLLADPLPSFRNLYGQALRQAGFEVFVACDEIQIFDILSNHSIDLILIDPIMGDPELKHASKTLLSRLQSENPRLIIFVFSWIEEGLFDNPHAQTATLRFLPKGDVDPGKLAAFLRAHFREGVALGARRYMNRQMENEL